MPNSTSLQAVVVHPGLPGFATLSEDGYVNVWDAETLAQRCQFQASDDLPISGVRQLRHCCADSNLIDH